MQPLSDIKPILGKYTGDISRTIREILADSPPFLGGMLRYHFGMANEKFEPVVAESGKMLRPVLVLLVFDALTDTFQPALPAAAAIEMIHNFSLLHDDVEDGDRERRGRPTAWSIWGEALAINAGDYLYTLAFKTLTRLSPEHFRSEQILAAHQLVIDACLELTLGQDMDIRFEQQLDTPIDMYLDMIDKKTGALLKAAVLTGATLGTTDSNIIRNYGLFAHNIGLAFQIQDDILGIWGDASQTGKSVSNDLRRKKKTLPVLYTLNTLADNERLNTLYASDDLLTDQEIEFVRECLQTTDAFTFARWEAEKYIDKAFEALGAIRLTSQAHKDLEKIARFLVERHY
jgi:geranylgeranyl diphosphate synthase type I